MEINDPIFVHAADLHLGSPLKSLGQNLDSQFIAELIKLVGKAFTNLIDATIRHNAEFIVLAGDIYDNAIGNAFAQFEFYNGLKRLVENKIGVYIVHGNHDPLTSDVLDVVDLPEEVVVFKSGSVTEVFHKLRDGSEVLVAGISFGQMHEPDNLSLKFRSIQRRHARAVIGLLHTNIDGTKGHDDYAPCSKSDLKDSPVDYWALGHVHQRTIGEIGSNRFWAYPGNLHGRFAKEQGEKGALVIPILKQGVGKPQFIPLHEFSFKTITVDCTKLTVMNEVAANIKTNLKQELLDKKVILTVILEGRSQVYDVIKIIQSEKDPEKLKGSLKQFVNMIGMPEGQVLLEQIINNLLPDVDLEVLATADDLLGDLLRNLDRITISELMTQDDKGGNVILTDEEFISLKNRMKSDFVGDFSSTSDSQV